MLWKLTRSEMIKQLKGKTFWVFCIAIILFYVTQYYPEGSPSAIYPTKGQEYYGWTTEVSEIEEMVQNYRILKSEIRDGQTTKFALLSRYVDIDGSTAEIILEELLEMVPSGKIDNPKVDIAVSYETYEEIMRDVDSLLGGDTRYGDKFRSGGRSITYDEAYQRFLNLGKEDQFTRASARLFGDYMGLTAAIFPAFLMVITLIVRNKEILAEQVTTGQTNTNTFLLSKILATSILSVVSYMFLALHASMDFIIFASKGDYSIDYFAFFQILFLWILPTILYSITLSMLTIIISGKTWIGILTPLLHSYLTLGPLSGDYGFHKNVIRFNLLGSSQVYQAVKSAILLNRLFYMGLSGILFAISLYVLKNKRQSVTLQ